MRILVQTNLKLKGGSEGSEGIEVRYQPANHNSIRILTGMYPCNRISRSLLRDIVYELNKIITRDTCEHAKKIAIVKLLKDAHTQKSVRDLRAFQYGCCPCEITSET